MLKRVKRITGLLWALRPGGDIKKRTGEIVKSHGLRVAVEGNIPDKQCIMVANHLGYLDPIVIASLVKCRPVAKSELSKWPGLGRALKRLGLIFYKRGDVCSGYKTLRKAIEALGDGDRILVFPEGTTTDGKKVLLFKRGIFGIAKRLNIPVVPIRVDFRDRSCAWWGEGSLVAHYWKQANRKHTDIRVQFFEPIKPGDYTVNLLTQHAHKQISMGGISREDQVLSESRKEPR